MTERNRMTLQEWENKMLADPIAPTLSPEHKEHLPEDPEYIPSGSLMDDQIRCMCKRCMIIRIKKRLSRRFPTTKCPRCGTLYTGIFNLCNSCRGEDL